MSADPRPKGRFPAALKPTPSRTTTVKGPPEPLRPQRLLAEAARDARRLTPASGLGLDTPAMQRRMVERLRQDGVHCEPVLQAMLAVPRHHFVDSALAAQAYEDTSLPIGLGQTISKPSVVARMMEWLFLGPSARRHGHLGKVLEIGTGCGYQAALLAQVARQVTSIERLQPLHELARRQLARQSALHVQLIYGDGMLGHPPRAPYDSIVSAAGGDDVPAAWLAQLAVGGRLVAPARSPDGRTQVLVVIDRTEQGFHRTVGEMVQFVPLKSGVC